MKTLTALAIKVAAKAKMDQAKTVAASPAGDDSKSAGREENQKK